MRELMLCTDTNRARQRGRHREATTASRTEGPRPGYATTTEISGEFIAEDGCSAGESGAARVSHIYVTYVSP